MRRRRSRRSRQALPAVLLLAALVVGTSVLPAASYSAATVDRGLSVGVADDPNAVLGLVVAENVTVGATDSLVVVTNDLGADATVTVALRSDSASKGTLAVDGRTGDEVAFSLPAGASGTVDVSVANESGNVGTDLVFHVTAESDGTTATASDRRSTIGGAS